MIHGDLFRWDGIGGSCIREGREGRAEKLEPLSERLSEEGFLLQRGADLSVYGMMLFKAIP